MAVSWFDAKDLVPAAKAKLKQAKLVLDIGCGIRPQKYIHPETHICWEPFAQYLEHLQTSLAGDTGTQYIYVKGGWAEAVKMLLPQSIDTIFLLDVVEHLDKAKGLKLLERTKRIARQQIVIYTPLGFLPQHSPDGKDLWGLNGGVWQEHKSGWVPEDFDAKWEVYAAQKYHLRNGVDYGAIFAIYNQ